MTGRQRVLAALNREEADRVPIDIGSTWNSTATIPFYEKLKQHFGIDCPTVMVDRMMQACQLDERILRRLHVDTRPVYYGKPELERNQEIELAENRYRDMWGVEYVKPKSSYYYDLCKSPLAGEVTKQDILNHLWPEPYDPGYTRGLREHVQEMRDQSDCALVLNLSLWVLQCSQGVRGYEDWFLDAAMAPDLLECLADCITDSMVGTLQMVTEEIGDLVDVITVSDDLGHQDRLCMSPESYRRIFKPRHARMMEVIKAWSDAPVIWHTCGSVVQALDDLIHIGVDGIHPVQTTARNMEPERLKQDYGDKLAFWGGIDTMRVLNHGDEDAVRRETRYKIGTLGSGGGYVLGAVHNVQPDVPVENLLTMVDTALECCSFFTTEDHNKTAPSGTTSGGNLTLSAAL